MAKPCIVFVLRDPKGRLIFDSSSTRKDQVKEWIAEKLLHEGKVDHTDLVPTGTEDEDYDPFDSGGYYNGMGMWVRASRPNRPCRKEKSKLKQEIQKLSKQGWKIVKAKLQEVA